MAISRDFGVFPPCAGSFPVPTLSYGISLAPMEDLRYFLSQEVLDGLLYRCPSATRDQSIKRLLIEFQPLWFRSICRVFRTLFFGPFFRIFHSFSRVNFPAHFSILSVVWAWFQKIRFFGPRFCRFFGPFLGPFSPIFRAIFRPIFRGHFFGPFFRF